MKANNTTNEHAADYLDPWERERYRRGLYKPVSDTAAGYY